MEVEYCCGIVETAVAERYLEAVETRNTVVADHNIAEYVHKSCSTDGSLEALDTCNQE